MEKIETALPGVYIVKPQVFGDHRGWFMEVYSRRTFEALGLERDWVQDNLSYTAQKGTLRGLHFQNDPAAQCKLVRAARGALLDVVVDLRGGSPTYLKWISVELSEENRLMLFVPRGFAHGFVTLTDSVEFSYKVDNLYAPKQERGIRFDDPSIGVEWGIEEPILNERDKNAPLVKDSDCNFVYTEL